MKPTARRPSATPRLFSVEMKSSWPFASLTRNVERSRLAPKTLLISPIFVPVSSVMSYVARGSKRWRALIRSSSVDLEASV